MSKLSAAFKVGELYSSEEIQRSLNVGNAGGVRLCTVNGIPRRMVIMTSPGTARQLKENPYHDRIEGNILVYTGAGREGDQTLGGVNQRIPQQQSLQFPVYGFIIIGSRRDKSIGPKRWRYLGLLEYLRHYREVQMDTKSKERRTWVFELRIHTRPNVVLPRNDITTFTEVLAIAASETPVAAEDRDVASLDVQKRAASAIEASRIEMVRTRLLGVCPETFEHIVRAALEKTGFSDVVVTQYSQDGGIDVNARASPEMWAIQGLRLQVQAKRWLHTVGRREVAELRGSLLPHARGAVVTTSHFSRAAINEATDSGKNPITLVDGFSFAALIDRLRITI